MSKRHGLYKSIPAGLPNGMRLTDCFREMKNVLTVLGIDSYPIRFKGGVEIVENVRVE